MSAVGLGRRLRQRSDSGILRKSTGGGRAFAGICRVSRKTKVYIRSAHIGIRRFEAVFGAV